MDWEHILADRSRRMNASEIRELLKLLDQPDIISFAGGIPDPALFPAEAFQDAFSSILSGDRQEQALQYSVSEGHTPLRQWLVEHMAQLGIPCTIDNILITSGSQQALDYLGKLFLAPKDTALVTWPTYLGALGAFNAYEPTYDRLLPNSNRLPEDYRGAAHAKDGAVKFAYCSVDFANPTGETLDRFARQDILQLADELDIAVIEDAAYQSLRYDGEVLPPILAMEIEQRSTIEDCRTIYCGSFSKTLAPGLRVGWVCAAKPVISRLVLIKQSSDLHTSTLNQMAIADVANACFDQQVEKIKAVYQSRRDCMLQALSTHMPPGVSWTRPEGGMFVWLTLPSHIDGAELLSAAIATQKLAFVPGKAFFADGSGANTLRLNFTRTDATLIDEGIRRLGVVLKEAA